jgi:hypothetical protein
MAAIPAHLAPADITLDDLAGLRADLRDICDVLYAEPVDYIHVNGKGQYVGAFFAIEGNDFVSDANRPADDDEAQVFHVLVQQLVDGVAAHRRLTDDYVKVYGLGGVDLWIRE